MRELTEAEKVIADLYAKHAVMFSSAIFFGPPRREVRDDSVINNATITLLKMDGRQLGVTNHHVLEEYQRRREAGEALICQIGNVEIDPMASLVSESRHYDLAVFDLSNVDATGIRTKDSDIPCQYFEPRRWPPSEVAEGQFVLFGGFPGGRRTRINAGHYLFGAASSGGTEVVSVRNDVIVARILIEQCIRNYGDADADFMDLPGISGAPVMIARREESGVEVIDLVGFVFEFHRELDILRIRPAHLIDAWGVVLDRPI